MVETLKSRLGSKTKQKSLSSEIKNRILLLKNSKKNNKHKFVISCDIFEKLAFIRTFFSHHGKRQSTASDVLHLLFKSPLHFNDILFIYCL